MNLRHEHLSQRALALV